MKMEMRISAPQAGKIRKINCAVGDVVGRGQLLIEIEG
jgi:biotin carboxyl carrier protein